MAAGLAATAFAGVRVVVDQRMAALYRAPVAFGGWIILVTGLVALLAGIALVVYSERRT